MINKKTENTNKSRYEHYLKIINKCIFWSIHRDINKVIHYDSTEDLILLIEKYNIKFDKNMWTNFIQYCKDDNEIFNNIGFSYERSYVGPCTYEEYIQIYRYEGTDCKEAITKIDFETLNQRNGILVLQRVMLYYIETCIAAKNIRQYIKINPFDK